MAEDSSQSKRAEFLACRAGMSQWSAKRRQTWLEQYLCTVIAETLIQAPQNIDIKTPLVDLGLASFLALDLIMTVEADLELALSESTLQDFPNIQLLAEFLSAKLVVPPDTTHLAIPSLGIFYPASLSELWGIYQFAKELEPDELIILDPLVEGASDQIIAFDEMHASWQAQTLLPFAVKTLAGQGSVVGVFVGQKSPIISYCACESIITIQNCVTLSALIRAPYRGQVTTQTISTQVLNHPVFESHFKSGQLLGSVATTPSVWHAQLRLMADVMSYPVQAAEQIYQSLWQGGVLADEILECLKTRTDLANRLFEKMRNTNYGGIKGSDILCANTLPINDLELLLKQIIEPWRWPLVASFIKAQKEGRATFLGFELQWLEPLFAFKKI